MIQEKRSTHSPYLYAIMARVIVQHEVLDLGVDLILTWGKFGIAIVIQHIGDLKVLPLFYY